MSIYEPEVLRISDHMTMRIEKRLSEYSDKELEDLHGNAIRLAQSGTAAQQADAERILPLVGAEVERRAKLRAAEQIEGQQERHHGSPRKRLGRGNRKARP